MSPDNRKYDEETRAQSAERHATLIVRTVQSARARLIAKRGAIKVARRFNLDEDILDIYAARIINMANLNRRKR